MYARTMDDYFCRYIYKFVVIFNNIYGMNINNVYTVYINVHLYYTLPFISLNLYIFYPSCYSFFWHVRIIHGQILIKLFNDEILAANRKCRPL